MIKKPSNLVFLSAVQDLLRNDAYLKVSQVRGLYYVDGDESYHTQIFMSELGIFSYQFLIQNLLPISKLKQSTRLAKAMRIAMR